MFKFFIFAIFLAVSTAASIGQTADKQKSVPILSQGEEKNTDGSFSYYFEGADGAKRQEVGFLKNAGTEEESLVVKGSYRYFDIQPQGNIIPRIIAESALDAGVRSALEQRQQRQH